MVHDVIVLGAGVAGLQCARQLQRRGATVLVLDRADKPGGRCATRVINGTTADYGPLFLHGSDLEFLDAVRSASDDIIEGWPRRVEGHGKPCQPLAFAPGETRFGFVKGVNELPRALASGLELRLRFQAARIEANREGFAVEDGAGKRHESRDLVLALALEQCRPFLQQLPAEPFGSALALLKLFDTVSCLTVVAGYPEGVPMPAWDILYPDADDALLLVGNEPSKRGGPPVLVIQATPKWSRAHLQEPNGSWSEQILDRAQRLVGPWAARPSWTHPHRWRFARLDSANELAAPLLISRGSSRLGVCGDIFHPGGGVQAAWRSGGALAARL